MGDGNIWNLDPIATEKKKNLEKKRTDMTGLETRIVPQIKSLKGPLRAASLQTGGPPDRPSDHSRLRSPDWCPRFPTRAPWCQRIDH